MRQPLVLLILLGSLTTLACKKEETANPDDAASTTGGEDSPSTEEPATTEEPAAADAEITSVCQHMMQLMIADLGETLELSPEEQAIGTTACATELSSKRAENPELFATQLDCLTAATTLEQSTACG